MPNATRQPVEVGFVLVKGTMTRGEEAALLAAAREATKLLNGGQTRFHFSLHGADPLSGVARDERRGYALKQYYTALAPKRTEWNRDFMIAICNEVLESGSFNREDRAAGCGVITVKDFKRYVPYGIGMGQYVAYIALCVALFLNYPLLTEHTSRDFCLFDLCVSQEDLIECFKLHYIHQGCEAKLAANGVEREEIEGYQALLREICRRDLYEVVTGAYGLPAANFFFGVVVALASSVVATEWPRAGLAMAWWLLMTVALVYVSAVIRRWSSAKPSKIAVRRLALLIYVLVIVTGLIIIGRVGLPSDRPRQVAPSQTPTPGTQSG